MDLTTTEAELRELMVAGLDGDASAYKALLEKLSSRLRAYFRGHLARSGRGPVEVEDLVQEVLIAVHIHRHTYDRAQLFTPWIYAIARYKFLDHLRRTKDSASNIDTEHVEQILGRDDRDATDSALDMQKLMTRLSPKARQIIQYVKLDGLSVREAAARCGMSESAVKVTVHRGLKALAQLMREKTAS